MPGPFASLVPTRPRPVPCPRVSVAASDPLDYGPRAAIGMACVLRSLSGLRDDGVGGRPSLFQQARRRITRGASISALCLGSWRACSSSAWMLQGSAVGREGKPTDATQAQTRPRRRAPPPRHARFLEASPELLAGRLLEQRVTAWAASSKGTLDMLEHRQARARPESRRHVGHVVQPVLGYAVKNREHAASADGDRLVAHFSVPRGVRGVRQRAW